MFQWSKKVVKSVSFNPGVADESLLALVESHLEKDPDKSFSDLCKEALWQALCVPESVRPVSGSPMVLPEGKIAEETKSSNSAHAITGSNLGVEQQLAVLRRQMADLEERFFAKEANRLDVMERQILQLNQQIAQLAMVLTQGVTVQVSSMPSPPVADKRSNSSPGFSSPPPQEVDPVISRLSHLVDDF